MTLQSKINVLHKDITKSDLILSQKTNCEFLKFGLHGLRDKTIKVFDIGVTIISNGKLLAGSI